ncbi:hypothetical protein JCM1841_003996 [Sporobolomyces salmonicolor]
MPASKHSRHSCAAVGAEETSTEEEERLPRFVPRQVKAFFESTPVFRRCNDNDGPFEAIIRVLNRIYVLRWLSDPGKSHGRAAKAYYDAIVNMSSFPCRIESIESVKAIGNTIAKVILDARSYGSSGRPQDKVDPTIPLKLELLQVRGIGPKKLGELNQQGIHTLNDLRKANLDEYEFFFRHELALYLPAGKVIDLHGQLQSAVDSQESPVGKVTLCLVGGALRGKTKCHDIDLVAVAEHAREDELYRVRDFVLKSFCKSGFIPSPDCVWTTADRRLPVVLDGGCPCGFEGLPFAKGVVKVSSSAHDRDSPMFRFDLVVSHPTFLGATLMFWTSGGAWLRSLHRYCINE